MNNVIYYQGALKDLPYGTVVVDKSPVTGQVLRAVTDWVQRHYDGAATVALEDGRKIDITVKEAGSGST